MANLVPPDEIEDAPTMVFRENGILDNDGTPGTYTIIGDTMRMRGWGRSVLFQFKIEGDTLALISDLLSDHMKEDLDALKIPDSIKVEEFKMNIYLSREE